MVARYTQAVPEAGPGQKGVQAIAASHADLGERFLYCEGDVPLLFTENETNNERIFGTPNASRLRERRDQQLCGQRESGRSQPRENGNQICGTLSVECGCGKDSHHPSAAKRSGACGHGRSLQELC